LKQLMALLDENGDSFLSPAELGAHFSKGHRAEQVKQMAAGVQGGWAPFQEDLTSMDSDGSKSLSAAEVTKKGLTEAETAEEHALFEFADVSGDGELDSAEYLLFVSVITKSEMESLKAAADHAVAPLATQIMKSMDNDGNGLISLEEVQANAMDLLEPLATGKARVPITEGRSTITDTKPALPGSSDSAPPVSGDV
jgi:hypothetical protein